MPDIVRERRISQQQEFKETLRLKWLPDGFQEKRQDLQGFPPAGRALFADSAKAKAMQNAVKQTRVAMANDGDALVVALRQIARQLRCQRCLVPSGDLNDFRCGVRRGVFRLIKLAPL